MTLTLFFLSATEDLAAASCRNLDFILEAIPRSGKASPSYEEEEGVGEEKKEREEQREEEGEGLKDG